MLARPAVRAFRANQAGVVGLGLVVLFLGAALFADWIAPFPAHAGPVGDFAAMNAPLAPPYLLGTDTIGRDLLTRILYAYRLSLEMAVVVLAITVPVGVGIGLLAGYRAERHEGYVLAAETIGAGVPHILLREVLGRLCPQPEDGERCCDQDDRPTSMSRRAGQRARRDGAGAPCN